MTSTLIENLICNHFEDNASSPTETASFFKDTEWIILKKRFMFVDFLINKHLWCLGWRDSKANARGVTLRITQVGVRFLKL